MPQNIDPCRTVIRHGSIKPRQSGCTGRVRTAGAALLMLALSALGSSADPSRPVSGVDARGRRVTLPSAPRRIISLAPSVTEILFAIGAGPRVVGVTRYCDYPPQAKQIAKVGDYSTSIEKVLGLRPDLVVADLDANSRAVQAMDKLETLRGRVFAVRQANMKQLLSTIRAVGVVTDCRAGANRTTSSMERTMDEVKRRVARAGRRPSVVFLVQREPLWVAGSGTFMHEMIVAAGGTNLGARAGTGYCSMGLERLIALAPEHLISTHSGLRELRSRPGWSRIKAIREGRVHVLGYEAVRPGPRLADAIREIAHILFPALI